MAPVIDARGLTHEYPDGTIAIRDVTLSIEQGERVAVVGANGSGKSTLQLALGGLVDPSAGTVEYFGETTDAEAVRDRLGVLLQDPNDYLFNTTVREDLEYGPAQLGLSREAATRRVPNPEPAEYEMATVREAQSADARGAEIEHRIRARDGVDDDRLRRRSGEPARPECPGGPERPVSQQDRRARAGPVQRRREARERVRAGPARPGTSVGRDVQLRRRPRRRRPCLGPRLARPGCGRVRPRLRRFPSRGRIRTRSGLCSRL